MAKPYAIPTRGKMASGAGWISMCGIAGFVQFGGLELGAERTLADMNAAIIRRGPDSGDTWIDGAAGIALAHRRLAVIDLSEAGRQPMHSPSGRYVLNYNGEIYNFEALRGLLSGHNWVGHSDTEVLLAAIEDWGLEKALEQTVGMFGLALWDRQEQVLYLARDRLGEKPLYYGWVNGAFAFASDLAALYRFPGWVGQIDRGALALYMRHNNVPAPYTIFEGIWKVRPGEIVSLAQSTWVPAHSTYWRPGDAANSGITHPFAGTPEDAVGELDRLLKQSLAGQLVADVPIGAFLSGGIDSSAVVGAMQTLSSRPVRTFTIGVAESGYDEAKNAAEVARYLQTDHTELYLAPQEAMEIIPNLPDAYSEPFGDSSQIPLMLVSRLARASVTVAVSGDGGDELFSGYTRYGLSERLRRTVFALPPRLRRAIAAGITGVPPAWWDWLATPAGAVLPQKYRLARVGDKVHKGALLMAERGSREMYRNLVSQWKEPELLVLGAHEPPTVLSEGSGLEYESFVKEMMYLDLVNYMPDDILTKVDRSSMWHSLEVRAPLLDHRLVEFALSVPIALHRHGGQSKWLLRSVLERYLPRAMFERPKMGFGIPLDAWLRGPLRGWAEALLGEQRLRDRGLLNVEAVRDAWMAHLSGRQNLQHQLWNVLMFEAWLDRYDGHISKLPS